MNTRQGGGMNKEEKKLGVSKSNDAYWRCYPQPEVDPFTLLIKEYLMRNLQ